MKSSIILLLLIVQFHVSAGQVTIKGTVRSAQNVEAIAYANIGIINTEVGTISNEDGSFTIQIPSKYKQQYLIFSSLGYQRKVISLDSMENSQFLEILLDESVIELQEVSIISQKIRKRKVEIGNGSSLLLSGQLAIDTLYAGGAIALLIDKSHLPDLTFVHGASLFIPRNLMPSFKVRMRILAVDSTNGGRPGQDILDEQIIVSSTIRKGWLQFPVENMNQINVSAFYLTFEWILNKEDRRYIAGKYDEYMRLNPDRVEYDTTTINGEEVITRRIGKVLAGTIFGTTNSKKDKQKFATYHRDNSFGKWENSGGTLSAKIELANYPLQPTNQAKQ